VRRFRVMSALLVVASIAAPTFAAESAATGSPASAPTHRSLTTLSEASASLLRDTGTAAAQSTAPADSRQFFKTKKGAAVVALLVAGFSYTLYSKFHDEIKSAVREQ
jgi:hypothetical protein